MKELGRIIKLHTISDPRGNLTVSEENIELPFDLKRAYWIYDVPQGGNRGGHAHKKLQQVIIAVLVFGGLWGFWGVFFAIPLATLVKAVLNAWPKRDDLPRPAP
jgi:hypothetical protein